MINTKDKLLLVGGIIFIIALVAMGIFLGPKPKESVDNKIPIVGPSDPFDNSVVSVEPLENQKGLSVVPQMSVTFSKTIIGKTIELKSDPKADFSFGVSLDGEKIDFSPVGPLKKNTDYSVQIIIGGDPLFSWSVRTKNKGTNQANLASVVNKIRDKTPFIGSGFRVSYDAATDQFFVFVDKAPVETYKSRANVWLRDQGLKDFEALNINYVVKGSLIR